MHNKIYHILNTDVMSNKLTIFVPEKKQFSITMSHVRDARQESGYKGGE